MQETMHIGSEDVWELSIIRAHFCCEPKTAVKK